MKKHKVLIVDDHPIVLQGLRSLIEEEEDLAVCGEATDACHALEAIKALTPDIAVMDLSFKGVIAYDVFHGIGAQYPGLPVLVLSMHEESVHAERVLRAGARGYIMKSEATEKLIAAIRKVMAGEIWLSERMAGRILNRFANGTEDLPRSRLDGLTNRELEVFRMIGQGLRTRVIADQLRLSPKTVESHRERIKEKLVLQDAAALNQYAIRWVHSPSGGRI